MRLYDASMLIYCCADLIFATKVKATADAAGKPARPARDATMLQARLEQVEDGRINEPVTGVIVDLDLGDTALALIDQVRAHAPQLPVVAFGPHVAVALLETARQRGAHVLTRGAFTAQLPQLVDSLGS